MQLAAVLGLWTPWFNKLHQILRIDVKKAQYNAHKQAKTKEFIYECVSKGTASKHKH